MKKLGAQKFAVFRLTGYRVRGFSSNAAKRYTSVAEVSKELKTDPAVDAKDIPDTASVETALEDTNISIPDHKPVKPYEKIFNEMEERTNVPRDPPFERSFNKGLAYYFKPLTHNEMRRPPRRGDLVLVRSVPVVVIGMSSTSAEGRLTIANQVGEIRDIGLGSVEARLGSLIDGNIIAKRTTIVPGEKHVVRELHDFLAVELRDFVYRSTTLGTKLQSTIRDVLLLLQREDEPQTLPFFDFAGMVLKFNVKHARPLTYPDDFVSASDVSPSELTPELIYAVRMALSQYTLANKHVLEFHHSSNYMLTVLPRAVEERNLRILTASELPDIASKDGKARIPRPLLEYTKDYAVGNLTRSRPDADGAALEIIRKHPGFEKRDLSSDVAAEMVNRYGLLNPEGPKLDRFNTQWFQNEPPALDLDKSLDIANKNREIFEPEVYCIDGETAHEIDDGISVQLNGRTLTVGVHIADPTSALGIDCVSPVYRRPTTVYLPTGARFMLPENVFSAFSLQNGSRALSVLMDFPVDSSGEILQTKAGPQPKNVRVKAHTLKNVKSITYNQVDELFKTHKVPSEIAQLHTLATALRKSRPFRLAFSGTPPPMVAVNNGKPSFMPSLSTGISTATEIVTEMMILANSTIASYMDKHSIPAIFRCQNLIFWSSSEKARFYEAFRATGNVGLEFRRNLPRAFLSTKAAPHKALDLDAYTHFTSPLRRGQDIFAHLQLHAHIQGNLPPLSPPRLAAMIPWIETAQKIAKDTERSARRYWTLVALEPKLNQVFEGVVSFAKEDSATADVYLPEWGINAVINRKVPLGTKGKFRILDVNAVGDRLVVDFA